MQKKVQPRSKKGKFKKKFYISILAMDSGRCQPTISEAFARRDWLVLIRLPHGDYKFHDFLQCFWFVCSSCKILFESEKERKKLFLHLRLFVVLLDNRKSRVKVDLTVSQTSKDCTVKLFHIHSYSTK